jgi:hypothetical protein
MIMRSNTFDAAFTWQYHYCTSTLCCAAGGEKNESHDAVIMTSQGRRGLNTTQMSNVATRSVLLLKPPNFVSVVVVFLLRPRCGLYGPRSVDGGDI